MRRTLLLTSATALAALAVLALPAHADSIGLDTTFGTGGTVSIPIPNFYVSVRYDLPDGRFGVVGSALPPGETKQRIAVLQFLENGAPDTSFGTNGVGYFAPGDPQASYSPSHVVLMPSGVLVISSSVFGPTDVCHYARVLPSGQLDMSFGFGGYYVLSNTPCSTGEMVALPNGGVMAAIHMGFGRLGLAKFDAAGFPDTTFGTQGVISTTTGSVDMGPDGLLLQADGKFVMVGAHSSGTTTRFIGRFNANGTIDYSFQPAGLANIGGHYTYGFGPTLQRDNATGELLTLGGPNEIIRFNLSGAVQPQPSQLVPLTNKQGGFLPDGSAYLLSDKLRHYLPSGAFDTAVGAIPLTPNTPASCSRCAMPDSAGRVIHFTSNAMTRYRLIARHAGDLTGDAKPDIVFRHTATGAAYLWQMNGITLDHDEPLPPLAPQWQVAAAIDWDRHGHGDLVLRDTVTGDVVLRRLGPGSALIEDVPLFTIDPSWIIEGVADFNADGWPDILWRNSVSGAAYIWSMDRYAFAGDQLLFTIDPVWKVENVGDFNGDGQPDLLFRNTSTGLAFVWYTNTSGGQVSLGASDFIFGIDPVWEVVQVADWNADGKVDLLFRNKDTGVVFVWYLDGITLAGSDFITQIDPSWEIVPRR